MLPRLKGKASCLVVNFAGEKEQEFAEAAAVLDGADGIDALEMNLSCPNVEGARLPFSTEAETVRRITAAVRKATGLPLIVKLSPNVTDIAALSAAALDAGGDILSIANTLLGMSVDWRKRKPRLNTGYGGLSGPAVKPVILRMVHQVWQRLRCPIIGVGGASDADDVMDYLVCGASAVQVGTANFMDPMSVPNIISGVEDRLKAEGIERLGDCIGSLRF
jgi:dihydroorotate dehydrogenase (NAD+) catalytic subunit